MNLQVHVFDHVTLIKIAGRIDTHTAQRLRQQLHASMEDSNKNIILDLGGVDFIDSSGLATIVHAMKQCRAGGGDLRLSKPPQTVRMVLELTRLDKAMDIYPTTEGALLSFVAPQVVTETQPALPVL
ncbi:MAG: STAS domain-containing protein [Caldilineaceae bacterium]|nr:STAS domain-containing protein [Caldilineaceae bacterium]